MFLWRFYFCLGRHIHLDTDCGRHRRRRLFTVRLTILLDVLAGRRWRWRWRWRRRRRRRRRRGSAVPLIPVMILMLELITIVVVIVIVTTVFVSVFIVVVVIMVYIATRKAVITWQLYNSDHSCCCRRFVTLFGRRWHQRRFWFIDRCSLIGNLARWIRIYRVVCIQVVVFDADLLFGFRSWKKRKINF